jgi:hypothetical protein
MNRKSKKEFEMGDDSGVSSASRKKKKKRTYDGSSEISKSSRKSRSVSITNTSEYSKPTELSALTHHRSQSRHRSVNSSEANVINPVGEKIMRSQGFVVVFIYS